MEKQKGHYGLPTAITMIIGIVIGSGIFFKGDDVLKYTGGSIGLGILVFCIGAIGIVFGSLTLIELSVRTERSGGVIGYYEEFFSNRVAAGFGWFQIFAYYPALVAVVCWVVAYYCSSLFEVKTTLEVQIFIALIFLVLLFAMNFFSMKLGGYFQNLSTVVKLIPLLGVAIAGFILKTSAPEIPAGVEIVKQNSEIGFGWLTALIPIAFSFDGWIAATTISNEVKNPKRTMPLAFIIGPISVLVVYLLYFVGFSKLLGPEYIMTMGNEAVNEAGRYLFGTYGVKIMLVFVIVAVLGVANGLILALIRLPQALAMNNMLPNSEKIAKIHPKYQLSKSSTWVAFGSSFVWLMLHYITSKTGVLGNGDVSEIAIVYSYICFTLLYFKVLSLKKAGEVKSAFFGVICPMLAILGSTIILVGGIISNPVYVPFFIFICFIISYCGYLYYKKKSKCS